MDLSTIAALGPVPAHVPYSKHECNFFDFIRKEKFQNVPFCHWRLWLLSSRGP